MVYKARGVVITWSSCPFSVGRKGKEYGSRGLDVVTKPSRSLCCTRIQYLWVFLQLFF